MKLELSVEGVFSRRGIDAMRERSAAALVVVNDCCCYGTTRQVRV